jgi:hypothetical protein
LTETAMVGLYIVIWSPRETWRSFSFIHRF